MRYSDSLRVPQKRLGGLFIAIGHEVIIGNIVDATHYSVSD